MTTPLFLLRCCEIGLGMSDLELLDFGTVVDMFTERSNDDYTYAKTAMQGDFDKF